MDKTRAAQLMKGNGNLAFLENKGQWNPAVRYQTNTGQASIFLTRGGVHYGLRRKKESQVDQAGAHPVLDRKKVSDLQYLFWNVAFLNANPEVRFKHHKQQKHRQHFYKGNRPVTNVGSFEEVQMTDLYPGVDVRYHGLEGNLKYDFLVGPGSEAAVIRLQYQGVETLAINEAGQLLVGTAWGDFLEDKPYSYQVIGGVKREVEVEYVLCGQHTVGFRVKQAYDRQRTLVIDPTLLWSTFLGGLGEDPAYGIGTDQDNNVVVTGWTSSVDFPTEQAADGTYNGGDYDVYVSKLSPDGSLLWSTYLGGSRTDASYDVKCDKNNNVYITGLTSSTDFPASGTAYQKNHQGGDDVFLARLDQAGTLVWASYYGGAIHETGEHISIDQQNNIIVTGNTRSFNFPVTANAYQKTIGGNITRWDVFTAKFTPAGEQIWSTFIGGSDDDFGQGVNVDSKGDIIISGETKSSDFPTKNAVQPDHRGVYDIILCKLSADGSSLHWSTYFGGSTPSEGVIEVSAEGVGIDSRDNIYIAGFTNCPDFPITLNPPTPWGDIGYSLFCAKFNNNGAREWSTIYGTVQSAYFSSLFVSKCDQLWVTGYTFADPPQPTTSNAFKRAPSGHMSTREALIVSYGPTGTLQFASYYGGVRDDYGWGITGDTAGNVYVCGSTYSPDFPTKGAQQPFYYDLADAFVLRFTPDELAIDPSFAFNKEACTPEKTFTYTGAGASDFHWDFGDNTTSTEPNPKHTFQKEGTYLITLTASSSCTQALAQQEVIIGAAPQASFTTNTQCQQSSFQFTGSGSISLSWDFGDGTTGSEANPAHTYLQAGEYLVRVIASNGTCTDTASATIIVGSLPRVELGDPLKICRGEGHRLSAHFPGASYRWQDGSTEATFYATQPGTYWVEASNSCGRTSDTITVSVDGIPVINLGTDRSWCEGNAFVLDAGYPGASYRWQDGSTEATFYATQPGTYWVEASNACGVSKDTVEVTADCALFIPNVITPNGDEKNDRFVVQNLGTGSWKLEVYNRWGKLVYEKADYQNDWDGSGMEDGVYYYYLRKQDRSTISYKGWVHILR